MIRKVLSATGLLIAIPLVYGCGSDAATAPSGPSRLRASLATQEPFGHGGSGLTESSNAALGANNEPVHPADTALINPGIDTVLVLKRPFYLPYDVSVSGSAARSTSRRPAARSTSPLVLSGNARTSR